MKKFWKWMEKKGYAERSYSYLEKNRIWRIAIVESSHTNPSHQMLIGYMLQYMLEIYHIFIDMPFVFEKVTINHYYNHIVKQIEKKRVKSC